MKIKESAKEMIYLRRKGYIPGGLILFWAALIVVVTSLNFLSQGGSQNHKATQSQVQKADSLLGAKIEILADSLRQNQEAIERLDSNVTHGRDEAVDKISGKLDKIEKLILQEASPKKK